MLYIVCLYPTYVHLNKSLADVMKLDIDDLENTIKWLAVFTEAGNRDGWVGDGLFFKGQHSTEDYHGEMNAKVFEDWVSWCKLIHTHNHVVIHFCNIFIIFCAPTGSYAYKHCDVWWIEVILSEMDGGAK